MSEKVAIVTGGSSGIGRATAARLLKANYQIMICARGEDRLAEAKASLDVLGTVAYVAADVSDRSDAQTVIDRTLDEFGRLDALVNAHGVLGSFYPLLEVPETEWHSVLGINLFGPINMTTLAATALQETAGAIVNVSSINAIQAEPLVAPYGVSKAALVAFTQYAAGELAPLGVRVNAVLPGWVMTPMAAPYFEDADLVGKPIDTNMMGRPAEPDELASVIEFLLSGSASYLTGECLVADGGHTVQLAPLRARDTGNAA